MIAEPFLKVMTDGKRGVRVDNPDEIRICLPGARSPIPTGNISAGQYQATKQTDCKPESHSNPEIDILDDYRVGQRVRVIGLKSNKQSRLNGRVGMITAQDPEDLERVTVEVDSATGKAETLKIQPANLEIIEEASLDSLEEILETKARANEAYSRGDIDAAVTGYNKAISSLSLHKTSGGHSELTKCLCNRALCFLKQQKWHSAKADAALALKLEPANAKAHFRMACAIFREGEVASQTDINQTSFHTCVAVALVPKADASMTDLLGKVSEKSAKPVAKVHELKSVSTPSDLDIALRMEHIRFIVLLPGEFKGPAEVPHIVARDMTIAGLGQVTFLKNYTKVFRVVNARLHLSNVRVTDGCKYEPGYAALGVEGRNGWLTLSNCLVEDSCEVGILADEEGRCTIEDCQFRRLGSQAVEVREMGQVEIRRSQLTQVWRGVCAYAGARSVHMEEVLIENSSNEGVMASGDVQNSETKKLQQLQEFSGKQNDALGAPGWAQRKAERTLGRATSAFAKVRAEELGWNGRLVLAMSDCSIKHSRGVACSIDEGCAAVITRCTFEATITGTLNPWPGYGVLVKGGSDATIRYCRFVKNTIGASVGFNYDGVVLVEGCVFARNLVGDLEDQTCSKARQLEEDFRKIAPKDMLKKIDADRRLHEEAGAWSAQDGVRESGNKYLSKSERVPEIHEFQEHKQEIKGKQPLPQKLAWEAAARGSFDLATPCPCGFSCTELGNSAECNQLALGNHIDFPPFMCLPCSESLTTKQDDPNAQFYFQSEQVPSRHWCLLGQVISVQLPRTADAHSFMAAHGTEAAKSIKLRTKFGDQSAALPDVEVLLLSDEPLVMGSSKIEEGATLAVLYAEASEIDITKGIGQVFVKRNSLIYAFGATLEEVLNGACSAETSDSLKNLLPQKAMLKKLASAEFRTFDSHFSFAQWAGELEANLPMEIIPENLVPSPVQGVLGAEDLCSLLDDDDKLAEAIRQVEEALQEKTADGPFVITKERGRKKLQNKMKRARERLAKMEEGDKSASAQAEVVDIVAEQAQVLQPTEDYEEHPTVPDRSKMIGLGEVDEDGYHGVQWLPPWADVSARGWRSCRKASHLFLSYPKHIQRPLEKWCININPTAFCSDFTELSEGRSQPRVLSCWGHAPGRPGHRIPDMANGMRLWKLRPSEITFSQDSIGRKFTDGHSLDETLKQLLSGDCKVDEIEKIKITWHSHPWKSPGQARWWTYTGNRRLSLFQTLEEKGHLQFIVAEMVNVPVPEWRMTTKRPGDQPRRR